MERVFLSCGFRPEEEALRKIVARVIESHLLRVVEGDQLEGRPLAPGLQDLIRQCDALVAIVGWRAPDAGGPTSQFVLDELQHARSLNKNTLALWDGRVTVAGFSADYERAVYAPDDLVEALIKLSSSLGKWRDRSGHSLSAVLLPEDVARKVAKWAKLGAVECEYRFFRGDVYTDWQRAEVVPQPGGVIAYLRTSDLRHSVQVKVRVGNEHWQSVVHPQHVQIRLEQ